MNMMAPHRRPCFFPQALCEILTIAGKRLDEVTKKRPQVEAYFASLEKLAKSNKLPSRIRFLVRDLIDLRRNKWVPRREKIQVRFAPQALSPAGRLNQNPTVEAHPHT